VLGCLFAATAISAQAQSQSGINGTGGFVTACAGSNHGSGFTPGSNLSALFWDGSCTSNVFSGSGTATAPPATYSNIQTQTSNQSQGSAALGKFHLSASNSAPNNSNFAAAGANGGWTETLYADALNQTGHQGIAVVKIDVTGFLEAHGFAGSSMFGLTAYKNKNQLTIYNTQGLFNDGSQSSPISTDRQTAVWNVATDYYYISGTGTKDAYATINDVVEFAIPVVVGESFSFGVYGYAQAGMRSASGVAGISTADTDFSHTVTWGGLVGIYDMNHNLMSGATLTSASGEDWTRPLAAPVPEPESWAMLMAGIGLLAAAGRRRRQA
jgi:hypothetical protein